MTLSDVIFNKWDSAATIRTRPRRVLSEKDLEANLFFPAERLPLCVHPTICSLGCEAIRYIQIQSLYQYLNGIANIELELINNSTYKLYKNTVGVAFPDAMRLEALTVIIDEAYHALVALDLIHQVEQMTQIQPITMPETTEISSALERALITIQEEYRELFRLICISLSEQALTTDLIEVSHYKNMFPTFYLVMKDHVADEGRHARFSQQVLTFIWQQITPEIKTAITDPIVEFIELYDDYHVAKTFSRNLLHHLNVSETVVEEILKDTFVTPPCKPWETNNIVIKNMIQALKRSGILPDLSIRGVSYE